LGLKIKLHNATTIANLAGVGDKNLKVFKEYLGITVSIYGDKIITDATVEQEEFLETVFETLIKLAENKIVLQERDIIYVINVVQNGKLDGLYELYKNQKKIITNHRGKAIYPKTFNQRAYINAIYEYPLTFGIGPAGTGKTYLAVAAAVKALKEGKIKKIIITRPAVEAGESLGFLPGDLKEKVDPYLIPIYDALYEMLGVETTSALVEKKTIEIAPLAYMRGRTLEDAFIILDEAQNTTIAQMKMFLTRLGFNSIMVVTGDPSQVDLPTGKFSGLKDALNILKNLTDMKVIVFEKVDVIRHPLVQHIIERYESK